MDTKRTDLYPYQVWLIFLSIIVFQIGLSLKWQHEFFLYFFNNTLAFVEVVSSAYQDAMNSSQGFPVFFQFNKCGIGQYWPTLVPLVGLWQLRFFSSALFLPSNILYLAGAMAGIFFSTKQLTGNNLSGVLAAVIFSFYWIVNIQLVAFELLLATAACVAWSFYWYLRSCFFTCWAPSLMTGLFMILALYCDRVLPGLFVFAFFLVPENFKSRKSWLLMTATLTLVAIFLWPFYGVWIKGLFSNPNNPEAFATLFSQNNDHSSPYSVYSAVWHSPLAMGGHLSYYFICLTERLLGYGFTGLLLIGLFFFYRQRKPYARILWTVIGIPLAVLIFIIKKEYVYLFPLCIYFAIITGIGISLMGSRPTRFLLILGAIVLFLAQSFLLLNPNEKIKKILFSEQFELLAIPKVPRLFLYDYDPGKRNIRRRVRFLKEQLGFLVKQGVLPEGQEQMLLVDFWDYQLQSAAIFSLRVSFPKIKIFNGFFANTPELGNSCKEGFSYLLSDKKDYDLGNGRKGGVCSWKALLPLYQFPNGQITLYQVQQ